jgi:hypothetical protein
MPTAELLLEKSRDACRDPKSPEQPILALARIKIGEAEAQSFSQQACLVEPLSGPQS